MNSWPILQRELIVASRDWRTTYGRVHGPGLMLFVLSWILWIFRGIQGAGLPGDFIFRFTSSVCFGIAVFGGALRTSDFLSRERREETLVLLFLTDLSAGDIVWGKLCAGSIKAFYGLIATIPMLVVTMLLGGVQPGEVGRVAVNLLVTLFFSLSIGLLVSSLCRQQKRAQSMSGLVILLFVAGVPAGADALLKQAEWPVVSQVLYLFSPSYSQSMAYSSTIGLGTNYFWTSIAIQLGMALTSLGLTMRVLEQSWKMHPPGAKALTWKERWQQWTLGKPQIRLAYRSRLLERNAFYWLAARDRLGPWWTSLILAGGIATTIFCIIHYELPPMQIVAACVITSLILEYYFKLRVTSLAAQRFSEDRDSGALELILSTPTSVKEIVRGQRLALKRNFLWPLLCLWTIESTLFLGGYHLLRPQSEPWVLSFCAYLSLSIGDMLVLPWISMWAAMRVKKPVQAPGWALFQVALLPWFVLGGIVSGLAQWHLTAKWWQRAQPSTIIILAGIVWAGTTGLAAIMARSKLHRYFRVATTDRGQLKSLFGRVRRFVRRKTEFKVVEERLRQKQAPAG